MGNCCQNENTRDSEHERIGLNIPAPIPQDSKKNSLVDPNYSKMSMSKNQNNFININGLTQPQTNRNSLLSTPAQSGSSPNDIGFLSGSKNNVTEYNSFVSGLTPYKEKDIIQRIQQHHPNENIGDFVGRSKFSKEYSFFRSPMKNFYIITSIYTPTMSSLKIDLYNQFVQKMEQFGCRVVTIEFASQSSPFLVTEENFQPYNFQVRLEDPIYIRFNIINQVLKKLPEQWEWVGIIDYNVKFLDEKWIEKAQDCLRQNKIVQLFESSKEISSKDGLLTYKYGIVNYFENIHNGQQIDLQAFQQNFEGGKAWAFRKDFFTEYNNVVDIFVTGFEETFLSLCLYGQLTYLFSNYLSEESVRIFQKIEQIYFKTENQQSYLNCQIQVLQINQELQPQNILSSIQILNRLLTSLYIDSQGQIHLKSNDNKESKDEIKYLNKFLL